MAIDREKIIELGRKAGFSKHEGIITGGVSDLERFATLVAAATKAEEREAVAQIIEDAPPLVDYAINEIGGCLVCGFTPKLASEFIRARGETK